MRYRLSALMLLMLLAMLPMMDLLGAPGPDPSAILDIGPPQKTETVEQHRNREMDKLTRPDNLIIRKAWRDPEVRKIPSIAQLKPDRTISWLTENLRVTPNDKGNRLRLTFRASSRAEQVVILNSILRVYLKKREDRLKFRENGLRIIETGEPRLDELIKDEKNAENLQRYLQQKESAKAMKADAQAEIARLKKVAVIKWAK